MQLAKLGKEGPDISPISIGTWGIGGPPFWSSKDRGQSISTIQAAIDTGINLVDTAPVYGFGLAEEIVGEAIAGRRDKVVIATKCGLTWQSKELSSITNDLSPASIIKELEDSLKRLKTDYIDLYQIHFPDPKSAIEQVMVALYLLQRMGKTRFIGVSNFNVEQLKTAHEFAPIVSLQPKLNMLEQEIVGNELDVCVKKDIGVLAYSPLASGLLTGKYDRSSKFTGWRERGRIGIFQKKKLGQAFNTIEKLKTFAEDRNISLSHLAINWVINQKGVTSALLGMNTPGQVEDNMKSLEIKMTKKEKEEIGKILNQQTG
jgi:aryl-alcohol dehydrogenase-like predicted oxidoreductase